MSTPIISDKRWSIDLEKRIQEEHYRENYSTRYSFNPESEKELFIIDTPPPYPSGTWHIGAVAQYSMIDVIARSQRLLGKEVFFPWGVDRNGINIEFTVEKKTGKKMRTFERGKFIEICRETIDEYTQAMRETACRVGLSCDFEKEYLTDSPEFRGASQSIFVQLFKQGDIIEDYRPNIYDTIEKTTIADAEVQRITRKTKLCDVKWITEDGDELVISTTRPELICACGVVVVHPEDERYTHLVGKKLELPLPTKGRSNFVEIKQHPSVKMEFGSGVLMVCSFGDQNDVSIFRELGLSPFVAINLDGNITEIGGPLENLSVIDARKEAILLLETRGSLVSIKDHDQEIPVSERGNNPVEIILLKEWYVKQIDALDRMRNHIKEINFIPPRNQQFLDDWMNGISIDWPISRRRWYHTEVPIWYSEDEKMIIVPPSGSYVQPWRENPPDESEVLDRITREKIGSYSEMIDDLGALIPEEKVFDTWMDSSNSNLFVSGYLQDSSLFDKAFPTSIRPQGKEIVRTWLYYTLLKSTLLLNKPGFENIWIDGLGMDPWGRKMSKSLGNGIDANSVLECGAGGRTGSWKIKGLEGKQVNFRANKIGSECFRLWKACEAQVGDDFQINPEEIEAKYFGVLTKIFNVVRFASQFSIPDDLDQIPDDLDIEDRWILSEFSKMMQQTENSWEKIDIYSASQGLKNFGTGVFPSHWLEMAKSRLYDGDAKAAWTIHRIVRDYLQAFSPICPFFTHYLSTTLYGESAVDACHFPKLIGINDELLSLTEPIMNFNSIVWKTKKEMGISLNSEIQGMNIPAELENFSVQLTNMHKLIS
ncbi:MAG: class I tRNA ligase family protein [Euryarchaeota archaeon]|jgi:valyl-tRNA synthetase|nr:class I tRNA ligase family protein [Euryarchaeota archaeon]MBT3757483.1 class I tRNA ligase family protein [Euryarchaeota archaeon]MBT4050576.1 class I tRNA ligase family protein [Euryarchaeota archaeon]MBT4650708.1 class I tRNA ligase family protein [Euryarchaeota archaeon]MBT4961669.1 class I tRNA ligase family protein [Euryarchaeota archaeon]